MRRAILAFLAAAVALPALAANMSLWPAALPPTIRGTDGYVPIVHPAVPPEPGRTYKALFDVTKAAASPKAPAPGVLQAGDLVNTLVAGGVPMKQIKLVLVFHGGGVDAIRTDADYRARHGVANPNLPILDQLKKAGGQLDVCGQNLAGDKVDPKLLTPLVAVAADALVVLTTYQNQGYALMSF
jgi:intracellular sulfur oxidation DsrE/DsrF family protein